MSQHGSVFHLPLNQGAPPQVNLVSCQVLRLGLLENRDRRFLESSAHRPTILNVTQDFFFHYWKVNKHFYSRDFPCDPVTVHRDYPRSRLLKQLFLKEKKC